MPYEGPIFAQSEEPEVGGIWLEVGGNLLSHFIVILLDLTENKEIVLK